MADEEFDKQSLKLKHYVGALTPQQAEAGIGVAVQNASELLEDAKLLLNHGRWPRSASLSILAVEEIGKVSLLRGLLLCDSPTDLNGAWRRYRTHTKKNVLGMLPSLFKRLVRLRGQKKDFLIEDFRPLFDGSSNFPRMLESIKQIGFYSDCLGNVHWNLPRNSISEGLARTLLRTAEILISAIDSAAMETAPELEIWVKHLKGIWPRANMLVMKQALLQCYQEASKLGVLRGNQSPEDMVKFLL